MLFMDNYHSQRKLLFSLKIWSIVQIRIATFLVRVADHFPKAKIPSIMYFQAALTFFKDDFLFFKLQFVPLVEFMYLVSTCMPGESYRKQLGPLLLCLHDIFWVLINSLCVLILQFALSSWKVQQWEWVQHGWKCIQCVCSCEWSTHTKMHTGCFCEWTTHTNTHWVFLWMDNPHQNTH